MNAAIDTLIAIVISLRWFILRAIRRRNVPVSEHEDLAQVVLLKAIVDIRAGKLRIDEERDVRDCLRAWLHGITWRTVADWKRNQRRRDELALQIEPVCLDPTHRIEAREELRIVGYRLNREERRMLDAIGRGCTVIALSRESGIPPGTIGVRLWRVRRVLRKRFGRR